MHISAIGFMVCAGLAFVGWGLGAPALFGLLGSLAFGATALATINSLGGSSPLIYTPFAMLLLLSVAMRRRLWRDVGVLFRNSHIAWMVCGLMVYAVIGTLLFPRLFAGQTGVFIASRTERGVYEVPLAPVSGNISQTGYFLLGGVTFLAICVLLIRKNGFDDLRRAFFFWCILHTGMGLIDFVGKLAGLGDILAPIRTASYAMLTEVDQAGFARIAGAQAEASAFASLSLAAIAFTFTYWRRTGSRLAFVLTAILFVLLVMSTSSTAYVGLAILSAPMIFSICRSLVGARLDAQQALILIFGAVGALGVIALAVCNPHVFDPLVQLFNVAIVDKANSASGQERAYWNYISLKSLFDTGGLGVGLGSSRASSWPIAVLSQLGIVGALIFASLIGTLARPVQGRGGDADPEVTAVVASVRASALAGLVSNSLIGGTADPGMFFFISLAAIVVFTLRSSVPDVGPALAATA